MKIVGILTEFHPFHSGHAFFLRELREQCGEDTGIVCVMSGNFVQRGAPAMLPKEVRAEAALRGGADLVIELPVARALSSAEGFAEGAVSLMKAMGCVTHLGFGSECGDAAALRRVAHCLLSEEYQRELRDTLKSGASFAACRQKAAEALLAPEDAALLSQANNNLGVEYLKAVQKLAFPCDVLTVKRRGAGHDSDRREEYLSGSAVRTLLETGDWDAVRDAVPAESLSLYRCAFESGTAPVTLQSMEQLLLARVRTMEEADWAVLPDCSEGLHHRFYQAAQKAVSVEELLAQVKTKRYAYARLRRILMCALLGIDHAASAEQPAYLRVLGCTARGRTVLAQMRKTAQLPVLVKPADVKKLSEQARIQFLREVKATEYCRLSGPAWRNARPGQEWRMGPVILEKNTNDGEKGRKH